jgi:hypothetical protein
MKTKVPPSFVPPPKLGGGQGVVPELEIRLSKLRQQVQEMETSGAQAITDKRVGADMGDDFRENEGAKLVMEQHDMWYIRKVDLKRQITQLKLQIIKLKK